MDAIAERTVTLPSGVVLPYAEAGGPGGSIPVVLVHAYVESWRYFEPVLRSLSPSIHAFVPTQRDHGSVEGDFASYRISDFVSDVVDFMDAVGLARAVLVGASSGGLVCQVVATSLPQQVVGLVLISSPATLADKPGVTAMCEEIMALSDPIDARFVEQFVRGTSPDAVPEELVARLVNESLAVPPRYGESRSRAGWSPRDQWSGRRFWSRHCCCREVATHSSETTSRSCSIGSRTLSSSSTTESATVLISHAQTA